MALCPSKQTIFAFVDEFRAEHGEPAYLDVRRAFEHGMRALPTLMYVAEVRGGELRSRNYPLFTQDGEVLRAVGSTEAEALAKLAALCSVAVAEWAWATA